MVRIDSQLGDIVFMIMRTQAKINIHAILMMVVTHYIH